MADGLPSRRILDLDQDSTGRIWILDRLGITVYDSNTFTSNSSNDGIPPARIGALRIDDHDRVWVVSGPGLRLYQLEEVGRELPPVPESTVSANATIHLGILVDGDRTLIAAAGDDGVWVWLEEGGTASPPRRPEGDLPADLVTAITPFEGRLAIGTAAGLCFLDLAARLECDPRWGGAVHALALDPAPDDPERLWILADSNTDAGGGAAGGRSARLGFLRDGESTVVIEPPAFEPLLLHSPPESSYKIAMLRDRAGGFYFGTPVTFFYLSPERERGLEPLHLRRRLPGVGLSSLLLDRERNVWIGGPRGLSRIDSRRFWSLDQDHRLVEDEVTAMIEPSPGRLILGHNLGLTFVDGQEISTLAFDLPSGFSRNDHRVRYMAQDRRGDVWIAASNAGLLRLDRDRRITRELPETSVALAVTTDAEGLLWVATPQGLFQEIARKTGQKAKPRFAVRHKPPGIHDTRRLEVFDDGRILATTENGLLVFDRSGSWSRLYTSIAEANRMTALLDRPSGEVWVGTARGLYSLRDGRLAPITGPLATIQAPVYLLIEDPKGRVWIGTDDGVHRWNGTKLRHYTVRHGLSGRETNRGAGLVDHRGRVWIGTDRGISAYEEIYDRTLPAPRLELVEVDLDGVSAPLDRELHLTPERHNLIFRYRTISFSNEEELQVRYRLEGFDPELQGPVVLPAPEVRYTNLGPGTYRFRISAGWKGGLWSEEKLSAPIVIPTPIWRTKTFYGLLAALLFGLIYGGYRLRTRAVRIRATELEAVNRKLREAAEERERLIESLEAQNVELDRFTFTVSHDLKSPLVTIRGFVGFLWEALARRNFERMEEDLERIDDAARKMGRLLDELLELARVGHVVNLSDRVSLSALIGDVATLSKSSLQERHIEIHVAVDLPEVPGDPLRLRTVFQNLLDNAVKFTADQPHPRIEIWSELEDDRALVTVADNGIGIAPEHLEQIFGLFKRLHADAAGTGVGLALAERIIEAHGGEIWAESDGPGRGSRFVVALPLRPGDSE